MGGTLVVGRPGPDEYAPFYAEYIGRVAGDDPRTAVLSQSGELRAFLGKLSAGVGAERYAPGKWSVREVVGHLADAERVFAYRALRISRGDATPLAGFEENDYVAAAGYDRLPLGDVVAELVAVREATVALFRNLDAAAWARRGTANAVAVTVRALGYVILGHADHHLEVLRTRYRLGT